MSSLVIAGDTSGSVTLEAPAVAGSTVITLPNASGTLVTSTSGTAGAATNLAGGSAGVIPYQTGAGATAFSAAGTSGQVLTSAGTGTPTWTTPSAGALVFLSSITASGASTVDVETGFSSTYDNYMLVIDSFACSANNTGQFRFKTGGTYDAGSNYFYTNSAGGNGSTSAVTAGYFNFYSAISINGGYILNIFSANSVAGKICISNGSAFQSGTPGINSTGVVMNGWNNSGAIQGIRLYQTTGTISGTFKLYGIAKA